DVEDVAGADRLLGAGAFERELVGLDRDRARLDGLLVGVICGEGGAGLGDDGALSADDQLERLAFKRPGLTDARGGQASLIDRTARTKPDGGGCAVVRQAGRPVAE